MSDPSQSSPKLRVLLTNDDGPPGKFSPYIFGLWRHLTQDLGWDVKVVVPSSQKSWIGAAFQISDIIHGRYYYPKGSNAHGEVSGQSRPLNDGELGEWILLDGTPATCANIAIHNLYKGEIDLVLSGPNLGRNTSAAFSLSSGTIGAALSSSLSEVRAIALSYGTMANPVTEDLHLPAHKLAAKIVSHLYENWGPDPEGLRLSKEVDLYSVNVPMVPELLEDKMLPLHTTTIWRNGYGRLFKAYDEEKAPKLEQQTKPEAGPDAQQGRSWRDHDAAGQGQKQPAPEDVGDLVFKWAPEMKGIINPKEGECPSESDAFILGKGFVSITPLRATFAQPPSVGRGGEYKL